MRMHRLAIAAVALVALAGCKAPSYHRDVATSADFSKYSTYAWHPAGNSMTNDPRFRGDLISDRIERSANKALADIGLTPAGSPEEADLLIAFHASVDSRITAAQVQNHYGYDIFGGGWGYSTTYQAFYDQGTVILDVLENRPGGEDPLVYRGYVTGGIEEKSREPDEMDRNMDKHLREIMADWPGR
ncbi:MAG: DUF4136 domain-containing protein [Acidobacteria bacterium]|nr:DUF4136 domain-containing protein [Acidobacteriota bacterium]